MGQAPIFPSEAEPVAAMIHGRGAPSIIIEEGIVASQVTDMDESYTKDFTPKGAQKKSA